MWACSRLEACSGIGHVEGFSTQACWLGVWLLRGCGEEIGERAVTLKKDWCHVTSAYSGVGKSLKLTLLCGCFPVFIAIVFEDFFMGASNSGSVLLAVPHLWLVSIWHQTFTHFLLRPSHARQEAALCEVALRMSPGSLLQGSHPSAHTPGPDDGWGQCAEPPLHGHQRKVFITSDLLCSLSCFWLMTIPPLLPHFWDLW